MEDPNDNNATLMFRLREHVPFLKDTIMNLTSDKPQYQNIVALHKILTDNNKTFKLETLKKIENIILKLRSKTNYKAPPISPNDQDMFVSDNSDEEAKVKISFRRDPRIRSFNFEPPVEVEGKPKKTIFDRLGAIIPEPDTSKPPLSAADLERLLSDDKELLGNEPNFDSVFHRSSTCNLKPRNDVVLPQNHLHMSRWESPPKEDAPFIHDCPNFTRPPPQLPFGSSIPQFQNNPIVPLSNLSHSQQDSFQNVRIPGPYQIPPPHQNILPPIHPPYPRHNVFNQNIIPDRHNNNRFMSSTEKPQMDTRNNGNLYMAPFGNQFNNPRTSTEFLPSMYAAPVGHFQNFNNQFHFDKNTPNTYRAWREERGKFNGQGDNLQTAMSCERKIREQSAPIQGQELAKSVSNEYRAKSVSRCDEDVDSHPILKERERAILQDGDWPKSSGQERTISKDRERSKFRDNEWTRSADRESPKCIDRERSVSFDRNRAKSRNRERSTSSDSESRSTSKDKFRYGAKSRNREKSTSADSDCSMPSDKERSRSSDREQSKSIVGVRVKSIIREEPGTSRESVRPNERKKLVSNNTKRKRFASNRRKSMKNANINREPDESFQSPLDNLYTTSSQKSLQNFKIPKKGKVEEITPNVIEKGTVKINDSISSGQVNSTTIDQVKQGTDDTLNTKVSDKETDEDKSKSVVHTEKVKLAELNSGLPPAVKDEFKKLLSNLKEHVGAENPLLNIFGMLVACIDPPTVEKQSDTNDVPSSSSKVDAYLNKPKDEAVKVVLDNDPQRVRTKQNCTNATDKSRKIKQVNKKIRSKKKTVSSESNANLTESEDENRKRFSPMKQKHKIISKKYKRRKRAQLSTSESDISVVVSGDEDGNAVNDKPPKLKQTFRKVGKNFKTKENKISKSNMESVTTKIIKSRRHRKTELEKLHADNYKDSVVEEKKHKSRSRKSKRKIEPEINVDSSPIRKKIARAAKSTIVSYRNKEVQSLNDEKLKPKKNLNIADEIRKPITSSEPEYIASGKEKVSKPKEPKKQQMVLENESKNNSQEEIRANNTSIEDTEMKVEEIIIAGSLENENTKQICEANSELQKEVKHVNRELQEEESLRGVSDFTEVEHFKCAAEDLPRMMPNIRNILNNRYSVDISDTNVDSSNLEVPVIGEEGELNSNPQGTHSEEIQDIISETEYGEKVDDTTSQKKTKHLESEKVNLHVSTKIAKQLESTEEIEDSNRPESEVGAVKYSKREESQLMKTPQDSTEICNRIIEDSQNDILSHENGSQKTIVCEMDSANKSEDDIGGNEDKENDTVLDKLEHPEDEVTELFVQKIQNSTESQNSVSTKIAKQLENTEKIEDSNSPESEVGAVKYSERELMKTPQESPEICNRIVEDSQNDFLSHENGSEKTIVCEMDDRNHSEDDIGGNEDEKKDAVLGKLELPEGEVTEPFVQKTQKSTESQNNVHIFNINVKIAQMESLKMKIVSKSVNRNNVKKANSSTVTRDSIKKESVDKPGNGELEKSFTPTEVVSGQLENPKSGEAELLEPKLVENQKKSIKRDVHKIMCNLDDPKIETSDEGTHIVKSEEIKLKQNSENSGSDSNVNTESTTEKEIEYLKHSGSGEHLLNPIVPEKPSKTTSPSSTNLENKNKDEHCSIKNIQGAEATSASTDLLNILEKQNKDNCDTIVQIKEQKDPEPDLHYYIEGDPLTEYSCKVCDFHGLAIVGHYMMEHPNLACPISRLPPIVTEIAKKESDKLILTKQKIVNLRKHKHDFMCRFCSRQYHGVTSLHFYNHLSTHTGEFRFKCTSCTFQCSERKNLNEHYTNTHKLVVSYQKTNAEYTPPSVHIICGYVCSICNYLQMKKMTVKKHIKNHHLGDKALILKINMSSDYSRQPGVRCGKNSFKRLQRNMDLAERNVIDINNKLNEQTTSPNKSVKNETAITAESTVGSSDDSSKSLVHSNDMNLIDPNNSLVAVESSQLHPLKPGHTLTFVEPLVKQNTTTLINQKNSSAVVEHYEQSNIIKPEIDLTFVEFSSSKPIKVEKDLMFDEPSVKPVQLNTVKLMGTMPPLTKLSITTPTCTKTEKIASVSGIDVISTQHNIYKYICKKPFCIFSTDIRKVFGNHCDLTHKSGEAPLECYSCDDNQIVTMSQAFVHLCTHMDHEISNNDCPPLKFLAQGKEEGPKPKFSFKIVHVTSLAPNKNESSDTENKFDLNNVNNVKMVSFNTSVGEIESHQQVPSPEPVVSETKPLSTLTDSDILKCRVIPLTESEMSVPRKSPGVLTTWLSLKIFGRLFKCPFYTCHYTSTIQTEYAAHLETHKFETLVPCLYCNFKMDYSMYPIHLMVRHKDSHHGCPHCLYRAISKEYVKLHLRMEHKTAEQKVLFFNDKVVHCKYKPPPLKPIKKYLKPYLCGCSKKYYAKANFMEHIKNCSNPKSKLITQNDISMYNCRYCIFSEGTTSNFITHMSKCHPYYPLCIVTRLLKKHSSTMEDEDESIFENLRQLSCITSCSLCPYKNVLHWDLRNHMMTKHMIPECTVVPVDPFRRNMDSDEFIIRPAIDGKMVSERQIIKKMSCGKDYRIFMTDTHIAHKKVQLAPLTDPTDHNNIPVYAPLSQRYKCGAWKCQELILDDNLFKKHLKEHGEGDYRCPHCKVDLAPLKPDKFVLDHLLLHGNSLYNCNQCSYFNHNFHNMRNHYNKKHMGSGSNLVKVFGVGDQNADEEGKVLWKCGSCEDNFSLKIEAVEHAASKHFIDRQFKCANCEFKTSMKELFTWHYMANHAGLEINYNVAYYSKKYLMNSAIPPLISTMKKKPIMNVKVPAINLDSVIDSVATGEYLQGRKSERETLIHNHMASEVEPITSLNDSYDDKEMEFTILSSGVYERDPLDIDEETLANLNENEEIIGTDDLLVKLNEPTVDTKDDHNYWANGLMFLKDALPEIRNAKKPFMCSICEYGASGFGMMQTHIAQHSPKKADILDATGNKMNLILASFTCYYCSYTAYRRTDAIRHIKLTHINKNLIIIHTSSHLRETQHTFNKSRVKCGHCPQFCETSNSLRQHYVDNHMDKDFLSIEFFNKMPLMKKQPPDTNGGGSSSMSSSILPVLKMNPTNIKSYYGNGPDLTKEESEQVTTTLKVMNNELSINIAELSKYINIFPKLQIEDCEKSNMSHTLDE